MYYYWSFYSVLSLFCIFFPSSKGSKDVKQSYMLFIGFSLILLALFAGLRHESNDYDGYRQIYKEIPALDSLTGKWLFNRTVNAEIGFVLLSSFLKLFSSHVVLLMIIMAVLSVSINLYVIRKISPYVFLSILLYFVHNFLLKETIQIRQGLASAILMLGFVNFHKRYLFFFLILIAGSIQSTAYICLLPIFIAHRQLASRTYLILLVLTFVCTLVFSGRQLFGYILELVSLPESITYYFGWDLYDYDLGFLSPVLLKQLFVFFFLLYNKESLTEKYRHFNFIFNFYFLSILWYIYFNDFAILAGRISNLLSVGEVLLIPMLLSIVDKRYRIPLYFSIIVLAGIILFLNLRGGVIFPYKNIFL